MISKRIAMGVVLWIGSLSSVGEAGEKAPLPRPELTPGEVVEIQVEALQFNDRGGRDSGIATTFRFASPGNQEVTGPLAHFALIVKAPGYRPLINHRVAGYGAMIVKGGQALRRVTVVADDGQVVEYEFRLSKDPASGCWFTDGVIPVPAEPQIEPGKVASSPHFRSTPEIGIPFANLPGRATIPVV